MVAANRAPLANGMNMTHGGPVGHREIQRCRFGLAVGAAGVIPQSLQGVVGGRGHHCTDLALGLRSRLATHRAGDSVCPAQPHAHERAFIQSGIWHVGFSSDSGSEKICLARRHPGAEFDQVD